MRKYFVNTIISLLLCIFLLFAQIAPIFDELMGGLSVVYAMEDEEAVLADLEALSDAISAAANNELTTSGILCTSLATSDGAKYLLDSLHLPTVGQNGSIIEWSSTDESVISSDGTVTRPLKDNKEVTLTAQLSKGTYLMQSNSLTFTVASLESQIAGTPKFDNMKSYNEFSSVASNNQVDLKNGASISEGFLKLVGGTSKSEVQIFTESNKAESKAEFYAELVLRPIKHSKSIMIYIGGDYSSKAGINIIWNGTNFTFVDKSWEDGNATRLLTSELGKAVRLGLYVNPVNGTYNAWVNHKPVFTEPHRFLTSGDGHFKRFWIYMNENSPNTELHIDSYRFYSVAKSDETCVLDDLSHITKESLLMTSVAVENETKYLVDSLHLPNVGDNGSIIEWISSNEEVIALDGTVKRPYENDELVTIKAKVSKGNAVSYSDEFKFNVPALKSRISGVPKLSELTAYNDFKGDTLSDTQISPIRGVTVENSFLKVTGQNASSTGIDLYVANDKKVVTDAFYIEFVMKKRDRGTNIVMRFIDSDLAKYRLSISWGYNGLAIQDFESDSDGATYFPLSHEEIGIESRLGFYVDPVSETYDVWVNHKKLFTSPRHLRDIDSNIKKIEMYLNNNSDGRDFSIDSYRVYSVWKEMSDEDRVREDADALTDATLLAANEIGNNIVETDLSVPKRGKNGSTITWTSSAPHIITSDGKVTRQSGDGADKVTLTATISYNTAQPVTKTFIFKVLRNATELMLTPSVKTLRWEDHFDDPESNVRNVKYDIADTITKRKFQDSKYIVERNSEAIASGTGSITNFWASQGGYAQDYHKGILGLEINLGREGGVPVMVHLNSKDSKIYLSFTWGSTGDVIFDCRESGNDVSSKIVRLEKVATGSELKMTLLMDTEHSKFDAWINDKLYLANKYTRTPGVSDFQFMKLYYDGAIAGTWWIDHWKLYDAVIPDARKLDYDISSITVDSIVTKPLTYENYVNCDFNLPTELGHGSKVEWSCDRPDIVNVETGKLTKPSDMINDTPIKLTAHVTNGVFEKDVTFDFMIVRNGDNEDVRIAAEMEFFTDDLITDQDFDKIKTALNLISKGPLFGTDIVWTSSDPDTIATSGRINRPRWDKSAKNVTLTATIGGKEKKTFDFTVLPDDYIGDPMTTSDEDFFGVWNGTEWTTQPQLRYASYPKLSAVAEAAKTGDYTKAKQELYAYMYQRLASNIPGATRNSEYAEYMVNFGSETTYTNYYLGTGYAESSQYTKTEINLKNHGITAGTPKSLALLSKYRDSVDLSIAGLNYPNESMKPMLRLYVNGSPRYYTATKSSMIRAGNYRSNSYGSPAELKVKMFGPILGDETYRALLQFEFSDIADTDTIGDAALILYVKKSNDYSEPKEFYVMKEPDIAWEEDSVNWMSFSGLYYNFSGIDGGNNWTELAGSDIEYRYQCIRFDKFNCVASEYRHTGDEKYAYSIIYNIMDFLSTKGCLYQRALDSNLRLRNWMHLFRWIIDSEYMTPEICTAMMKRFFESITAHADETTQKANGAVSKNLSIISATSLFPEYTDSPRCSKKSIDFFVKDISDLFFADGAYIEDTGGYDWVSIKQYAEVKDILVSNGIESAEFDAYMQRAAYYHLLFRGPNGEHLGYGDETTIGKITYNKFPNLVNYYNDRQLQYLDTQGTKGEIINWTSKLFPDSSYVFLRSGWEKDAQMLFTNVRNGYIHNHCDDNGIILFGYGKNLLTDAGYVSYSTGPDRTAAASTFMHNTVEINGKNQANIVVDGNREVGIGTTDTFTANENFDLVSQTSRGYEHIGNKHKRTITFVKPDFYIVSDLMTPQNEDEVNTYKQYWHMKPDSGLYTKDNKIYSGYTDEGNIIIANADNLVPSDAIGVYTLDYGASGDAPYAFYTKQDNGSVTFDTVLLPCRTKNSELNVERINMGVPTSEATAIKINMNKDGNETTVYYMLDYTEGPERIFGNYKTDAQMAVVVEDKEGNVLEFIINGGSYIKKMDNSVYVDLGNSATDVSVVINNTDLEISTTDSNLDISNTQIKTATDIDNVRLNGQLKEFAKTADVIIPSNTDKEEVVINDNNQGTGIIQKPVSDAANTPGISPAPGGSGTSGGIGTSGGNIGVSTFSDISGHWAVNNIQKAYQLSIISGYPDGSFKPDNSITRAEFLTIVCRAIGLKGREYNGEYADVKSTDWYAPILSSAVDAGLVSRDVNFRPNESITREEICKITTVALKLSRNMGQIPKDYICDYADNDDISQWAKEYVTFVSYHNIMNGMDSGNFAPLKNATRGEAATVLIRAFDK